MKSRIGSQQPIIRNILGLFVLLAVYYIPDRFFLSQRPGFKQVVPYLFIVILYGWIVFHNRVLFEKLYLGGKKREYFLWTGLIMLVGSINMHLTIKYGFDDADTLPRILSFWIFTVTGLGIYVLYRYRHRFLEKPGGQPSGNELAAISFDFNADGKSYQIAFDEILYVESLENYIRLVTARKVYLVRLSLKETEQRLPSGSFLRISRSHIVNISSIEDFQNDTVKLIRQEFKVGKVYKRYVETQLKDRRRCHTAHDFSRGRNQMKD